MDAATVFADSTARVVLQVCGGGLVMDLDLLDSGDTERTAFVWVGAGGEFVLSMIAGGQQE